MTPNSGNKAQFEALDNAKTSGVHYKITALSAAGVFLDGYDISIIAVALTIITGISGFSYVNTPLGKGLMAASTTIGMFFGAIIFGYITDLKGRKFMYIWDMVIFIVLTALISGVSFNFDSLFHECTYLDDRRSDAEFWKHSTLSDALSVKSESHSKRFVPVHLTPPTETRARNLSRKDPSIVFPLRPITIV